MAVVREVGNEAANGAAVGGVYWGLLNAINATRGAAPSSLATAMALNPTPALLSVVGSGYIGYRYLLYLSTFITREQLMADVVFTGYSNGAGALVCLLGAQLGLAPAMCAIVGSLVGSAAACATYESWREESVMKVRKKLRRMAVITLDLRAIHRHDLVHLHE